MSARYPFTGPNYAQYGEVPGYIYYPWNDQYYIDPQQVQAYNESVGLAEPAPEEPSLFDTLLPVAGTAGALAVGKGLGQRLISGEWPSWLGGGNTPPVPVEPAVLPQAANQIALGGAGGVGNVGAAAAGGQLGGGAGSVPNILNITRAPMANPNGLSVLGQPLAGQGQLSSLGTNTFGSFGSGGMVPMLADTTGTVVAGYNLMDAYGNLQGDRKGVTEGLATGAGTAVGAFFGGPIGAGIGSVVGRTAGRGLNSLLKTAGIDGWRKSTEDYQRDIWEGLQNKGVVGADQAWALKQQQNQGDGTWQDGKYAGEKWTFEKALDLVKENPDGFLLEAGNFEAIPDWMTGYTHDQRREIVRQLANQDLYTSSKGSVLVKDKDKANAIAQAVKGGMNPQQPTQQGTSNPVPLGMLGDANRMQMQPAPAQPQQGPNMPAMLGGLQINPVQQLPPYYASAPAGQYKSPDGVNTYTVTPDGQVQQTMIGVLSPQRQIALQDKYPQDAPVFGMQQQPVTQQAVGMIPMPVRTNTLSPGIGLDGRPISY